MSEDKVVYDKENNKVFAMSMYSSRADLYEDMAKYYKGLYENLKQEVESLESRLFDAEMKDYFSNE